MSEPVLGEAGNASSGPAAFGQDGEEKPAMGDRQRDWAPSYLIALWTPPAARRRTAGRMAPSPQMTR